MNVYISCLLYDRKRKKEALEEDIPKKKVREMKYNKGFTERLCILESTSYNNKRYQQVQPNRNYYSRRYFCFPQRLWINKIIIGDLSNLIMAWYYAGYYTALYSKQHK